MSDMSGAKDADALLPRGADALKAIGPISGLMALREIRMDAGSFRRTSTADSGFAQTAFQHALDEDVLRAHVRYRFELASGDDQKDGVQVEGEYLLVYQIRSDVKPDPAATTCFARINGVYSSWPYWREFVHSSLLRSGFPNLVLPPLTIGRAVELAGLAPVAPDEA